MARRTTATTACARRRSAVRTAPRANRRGRDADGNGTGGKIGHAGARGGGVAGDGGAGRARAGSALLKGIVCLIPARPVPAFAAAPAVVAGEKAGVQARAFFDPPSEPNL